MKDKEMALVKEILAKLGASEEDQELVAEATVDADLKGFTSHGLGRFPQYLISIKAGTINLEDNIIIEKETPAIALINGNSGFGQAVSYKAMQIAIKKAKEVGIACVGVHNTNHFGVTGFYSDLALRENCIGLVLANTLMTPDPPRDRIGTIMSSFPLYMTKSSLRKRETLTA